MTQLRVPPMRRARGFRLYDSEGRRYIDLCLDGGGALFGHRGALAAAEMKSAISRGLVARISSAHEPRLLKSLARAFPDYRSMRLFGCRCRALEAVSQHLGMRIDQEEVLDPALVDPRNRLVRAAYWRPYLEPIAADALLPILPFSIGGSPSAVCFRELLGDEDLPSDALPGFILASARKAFDRLPLSRPSDSWAGLLPDGSRRWTRKGPYVRATFDAAEFPEVYARFLSEGVLLFPGYPGPSILPAEASPGERRLLADLFRSIPGG